MHCLDCYLLYLLFLGVGVGYSFVCLFVFKVIFLLWWSHFDGPVCFILMGSCIVVMYWLHGTLSVALKQGLMSFICPPAAVPSFCMLFGWIWNVSRKLNGIYICLLFRLPLTWGLSTSLRGSTGKLLKSSEHASRHWIRWECLLVIFSSLLFLFWVEEGGEVQYCIQSFRRFELLVEWIMVPGNECLV